MASKIAPGDFYESMMHPDAPDEMAFQIDRPTTDNDPLRTFSMEAVNEVAEQFRMFLMARVVARSEKVAMPKHLRAIVSLDWNPRHDMTNDPEVGPFFQISEDKGLEPLDHTKRHKWKEA